jgi:hypothetical protein
MITQILLTITHTKPIQDLTDKVAGRVWTLDGIGGMGEVDAKVIVPMTAAERADLIWTQQLEQQDLIDGVQQFFGIEP